MPFQPGDSNFFVQDAGESSSLSDAARAELATTYVTFKNHDGTPVTGKHVAITLTTDGTGIDDIQVITP